MTSLLLFSGGLDSVALAYWRRPDLLLHIDYGQLAAEGERTAARQIAHALTLPLKEVAMECRAIGAGELVGSPPVKASEASDWWPFRNQLLVTIGAAVAVQTEARLLLIGTVATDKHFRDGTAEFIDGLASVLSLQEGGLALEAPAIGMTSAELVRRSEVPLPILAWAHSCHSGKWACGVCRGCWKRQQLFIELGG